ncbi:ABC transporter ATP-binding protein [Saliniramus sp.]|uniref:ABC transporter ATP-binding protein n=1 Tax=Saliniramus sp. TaxID=2986772 RepID=UPI002BDB7E4F|nr:ABC transporter ATP-binding protein [Saliniramus sp.]HMB09384.1 ABC transporter ATP-binding protein [Saliniramus sp.]
MKRGGVRAIGAVRQDFAPWADPDAVPFIRFDDVTKRFGDQVAVVDLSLDIYQGEFFCLLGPSGCGKSTLMRMLAGFEAPTRGRVLLDGADLAGVAPNRRPVNMMFQSYALFPHMSVEKNIAYGLRQEGMARDAIAARVAEMLKLVQMERFAGRRPDQLSGGQKQRVALARALAKRPRVLLLDEPLGALDRKLREETQFELMDIQIALGTTFIVVTHDQEEAMTMADRIAVMDAGRVVQVATPGEIYEQPASRFVADFVGEINLFEARVEGARETDGALWALRASEGEAAFRVDDPDATLSPGDAVAVAVRPEKMRVFREAEARDAGAANTLAGEIWDIGYLGDWTVYRIKLDTGQIIRVTRANATRYTENPLDLEERVHVSFAPNAAVILRD